MSEHFKKYKNKFLIDNGYYEKEYISKDEASLLKQLKFKERKEYLVENKIHQEEYRPEDGYYRIRLHDLDLEELKLLISINNNKRLKNLELIAGAILLICFFIIIFTVVSRR